LIDFGLSLKGIRKFRRGLNLKQALNIEDMGLSADKSKCLSLGKAKKKKTPSTTPNKISGTPDYMSPESIVGEELNGETVD